MLYYTGLPAISSPITDMDWGRLQIKESSDSVFKDYDIRRGRVIEGRDMFNLAGRQRAVLDILEAGDTAAMREVQRCFTMLPELCIDFSKVVLLKGSRHWEKVSGFMEHEFLYLWDSFLWKHEQSRSQREHLAVMHAFLEYLNSRTDKYVLKGSSALTLCHDIDRFHESIELDGFGRGLSEIVEQFIRENERSHGTVSFEEEMDDTVQKIAIHYGNNRKLSIFANYPEEEMKDIEKVHGYQTYDRETLMKDKIDVFISRENIADLYDICGLYIKYGYMGWSRCILQQICEMVQQCRIERVEYLLFKQQTAWLDKTSFRNKIVEFYSLFGGQRILMHTARGYW